MKWQEEEHPRAPDGKFTDGAGEIFDSSIRNSPKQGYFGTIIPGQGEPWPGTEEKASNDKVASIPTLHLPRQEYAHVMSEIATNISKKQKNQRIAQKAIGNYVYTFENQGFGAYRIIDKSPIDTED